MNLLSQNSESFTVVVNLYQPTSEDEKLMFEEILMTQIQFYLESEIQWSGESLVLNKSAKKVKGSLNDLVREDVKFHNYRELEDFKSFSPIVDKKLENIISKTYRLVPSDFQSLSQLKKTQRNHQLKELLDLIRTELLIQAEKDVEQMQKEVYSDLSAEEKESLIAEIENYKDGDLLTPLKISYQTIEVEDDSGTFVGEPGKPDLADKILDLLAENSQKLEKLESELSQLRIDGGGGVVSGPVISEKDREILNMLPQKMSFFFNVGSSRLNSAALLQLNEVVEILAKSSQIKVVITGFADQTGNADSNLALSKKRAQAVKKFMKDSGMAESRFIINYYGESKPGTSSNQDRRVEIKFYID